MFSLDSCVKVISSLIVLLKTNFPPLIFFASSSGIFVSIVLFLLMKIIASKVCRKKIFNIPRQERENICQESELGENTFQDIYTIPSENKIVVNNFQVVINTCQCNVNCKDCQEHQENMKILKNNHDVDKDFLISVVKSKLSNLW